MNTQHGELRGEEVLVIGEPARVIKGRIPKPEGVRS